MVVVGGRWSGHWYGNTHSTMGISHSTSGGGGWFVAVVCGTLAPGAENDASNKALSETKPKIDLSGAKFNRVWRRKGRFWNRKEPTDTQQKIHERFPLFLGLKIEQCGRQAANKKFTSVSPLQGF